MNNNLKKSFEVLDLSTGATFEEAKQAWRDLAQVWHPDKHQNNERIKVKATEKLKEINSAWDDVKAWFELSKQARNNQREQARSTGNVLTYDDPHTGLTWAKNGDIAGNHMTFYEAINWLKMLNYGGYSDWHLPTRQQLTAFTLRERDHSRGWFNSNGFINIRKTKFSKYWTSSAKQGFFGSSQLCVFICDGECKEYSRQDRGYVWPVRYM